jgi:hypothetical protein
MSFLLTRDRCPLVLDEDGAGVEQVEALALRVLLGLRPWLASS